MFFRNYASELSAFSARIRETFDAEKLSEAFLNPSYVESEMLRQKELGMEEATLQLNTNERLAQHGQDFANNILLQYIRATFPYVPEEGISAFLNHVMSLDTLANISFHIGTRDLIKSEVIITNNYSLFCTEYVLYTICQVNQNIWCNKKERYICGLRAGLVGKIAVKKKAFYGSSVSL